MYLKRLEIHGFKSFAPPTRLEFGPGVTCIAGPNGAGKTNVAEAIRWVLGESASRIIRARKTEDIIFSGSASRNAMGMAEVKLTLDNADGWLPIEFEEVVVSRRAYRSGDNEYYINQSRVRLKDVTELFLKAQVGQNSYAFMGQGLVEQVLTLRPEERRGLIEEAADVRLYRDKLDDSRNKLAATRDNLERVNMLVREIEPRLRQLERQASRAAAHARLSKELAEALHLLYGHQWQEAQDAIILARATLDQRQEESEQAKQDVTTREEGLAALETALEERRREIERRQTEYRNIEDYRRDLMRRVASFEERLDMLARRREELTSEIESLRTERAGQEELLAQQAERVRTLAEELEAARTPDADMRALEAAEARLAELQDSLAQLDSDAKDSAARLAEAEGKASAVEGQQERLRDELARLEEERGGLMAQVKSWALEFKDRRERVATLVPAVQRNAGALERAGSRLERASVAASEHEGRLRGLDAEIKAIETRLEAAQEAEVDLPAPDAGVHALLAAGGKIPGEEFDPDSRIRGLIGMLGELIRVPNGLERSIEAALADALHAIVVETQEDALAAAELLVSEDLGRAVVFPLNGIHASPPVNLMEERGILGVASDLVRCEARYRPLVNALLGRTIVVENMGIGRAVLRRDLGHVVTRDGILLHRAGSIAAGSSKPVRRAISRQREVGHLPNQLEQARRAYDEASAALDTARREVDEARSEHDRLTPQVAHSRAELGEAERALQQQRSRLPAIGGRLTALHARRLDITTVLAHGDTALAAAREQVEQARARYADLDDQRAPLQKQTDELTAERERLLRRTATRTTRIAALEEEQETIERQRAMQAASVERIDEGIARREQLLGQAEEEAANVAARLDSTRRELETKTSESETALHELEPARHEVEQIGSRLRTLGEELAQARTRSMEAERALIEAESHLRLREEEVDALRERLEEEGFRPSEEGEIVPVAESEADEETSDEHGPPVWLTSERGGDGELPPMRGGAEIDTAALKERVHELRTEIRKLGPVNEQAEEDFGESRERYEFLKGQLTDLQQAEASLMEAIEELERIVKERFSTTFQNVNKQFQHYFTTFFRGGHGELQLTAPDAHGLPGVDIIAQPPRKKVRSLNMLSGGERSLTALALLFALLEANPSPMCVLDEVDAALDEANVDRFTAALRELAQRTQFIIITHNRRTLEMADTIYGVSMGADSISSVLSLRLSDIPKN